jgi:Flp pilus assembly protein TadD
MERHELSSAERHLPHAVLLIGLAIYTVCSCAGVREFAHPERVQQNWEHEVERHGVDPTGLINPIRYTAEMRDAARRAAGAGSTLDKLRALQAHLFNDETFPYDYGSRMTLTAVQAFEARRGNCVSFTNLFIALSRALGVPVRAALLTHGGDVERDGELVVVNNHIVAVYEHMGGATVFDFNRSTDRQNVGLRVIDDAWITAIYLNNRGAEELLEGRPESALRYLETTIRLAPDFAAAYGNLGIVRRRLDDDGGAYEAYRKALEIDENCPSVLTNLAALYQAQGRDAEAQAALRAADRRGATPYALVIRGDFAAADGDYREAKRLYRQAARLSRDLPGPYLAIARVELLREKPDRARRALHRVLEIDPGHATARKMLEELETGGSAVELPAGKKEPDPGS